MSQRTGVPTGPKPIELTVGGNPFATENIKSKPKAPGDPVSKVANFYRIVFKLATPVSLGSMLNPTKAVNSSRNRHRTTTAQSPKPISQTRTLCFSISSASCPMAPSFTSLNVTPRLSSSAVAAQVTTRKWRTKSRRAPSSRGPRLRKRKREH